MHLVVHKCGHVGVIIMSLISLVVSKKKKKLIVDNEKEIPIKLVQIVVQQAL